MTDLKIIEQGNGGDVNLSGKDLQQVYGFENMVYLALFGGNKVSTPVKRIESEQAFDWWGNALEPNNPSVQINSFTETLLNNTALNSAGRVKIEQAVKKDLEFMLPFSGVDVAVTLEGIDRVKIYVKLTEPDNQQIKEFEYIWDGTRQGLTDELAPMRTSPFVLTYEPETEDFLEAIGIVNDGTVYFPSTIYQIEGNQIWEHLDLFVVAVKNIFGLALGTNNLSTQFKYIYPRIGGTATAHKYNLVNPLLFQGTFFGGWTHDGGGATANGTNAYFNTNCVGGAISPIPDNINGTNHCFGVDLKTNSNALMMEVFCNDGARPFIHMYPRNAGLFTTADGQSGSPAYSDAVADSLGLFSVNRQSSASFKNVKDGVVVASHTETCVPEFSYVNILEASYSGSAQFSNRKRTLYFAGLSMTDTQMLDFVNAWRDLETILNR